MLTLFGSGKSLRKEIAWKTKRNNINKMKDGGGV
jgi:hypothetical protein